MSCPSIEPRHVLEALGEYEASLADLQRAYRALAATRAGPGRQRVEADYQRALEQARLMGARVKNVRAAAGSAA